LVHDSSVMGGFIRRVAADGTITAAAGNGIYAVPQPGLPALESPLQAVTELKATPDGGFLFGDSSAVYRVRPDGILVREVPESESGPFASSR
jgi:hypothetical protein